MRGLAAWPFFRHFQYHCKNEDSMMKIKKLALLICL